MIYKKKAISILISAVILVALTATLGLLVSSFFSSQAQKQAHIPPKHFFGGVLITEEVECQPTKISFISKNAATFNISGVKIFLKTVDGSDAYAENPNITLVPGGLQYVSVYLSEPVEGKIKRLIVCSMDPPNYCDEKGLADNIDCGQLSTSLGVGVEIDTGVWLEATEANTSYKFYQDAYMDEANITDYCVIIGSYPFCINSTSSTLLTPWTNVTIYKITNEYKKWVEEAESGVTTIHRIGGNPVNTDMTIRKDGSVWQTVTSDSNGYVEFTYNGPYPVVFELLK